MLDQETRNKILAATREEMEEAYDLLHVRHDMLALAAKAQFKVGDKVEWDSKKGGRTVSGKVTRILKKNVCVDEDGDKNLAWRVSPGLLRKVGSQVSTI